MVLSNPLGSQPLVKAGRLRPLAVTGPRRLAGLPDVPTMSEAGLKDFSSTFFLGLMGPAGLPGDIVVRLNREVNAALQRAEVQNWLSAQGMEPAGGSPEQFAARIRNDLDAMAKVIRDAGLRMN
jgi:tripartite-type tricarboxylate transporter receptor subunit TctC